MSLIADLPEKIKERTRCGLLFGRKGIVGRYARVIHDWTVYECLICGKEDFKTSKELVNHCISEHPER